MIDYDTPESAQVRPQCRRLITFLEAHNRLRVLDWQTMVTQTGETWELVFSDEFNTPGRSFYPGGARRASFL